MPILPDKPATVYAIRSKTTGRVYIGCSVDPIGRMNNHFMELKNSIGDKRLYCKSEAWKEDYVKYGKEDFELYFVEENVPLKSRAAREEYWIEKYKAMNPKYGYNVKPARSRARDIPVVPGRPPLPEG